MVKPILPYLCEDIVNLILSLSFCYYYTHAAPGEATCCWVTIWLDSDGIGECDGFMGVAGSS